MLYRTDYGALTLCGWAFQSHSSNTIQHLSSPAGDECDNLNTKLTASADSYISPVWTLPLSLAATKRISHLISFPRGTKMFQFPRLPSDGYVFTVECRDITPGGFPHSDICGSTPARGYPQLIAACHVLLRPQAPRHSPCALNILTLLANRPPMTSPIYITGTLAAKSIADYCI